MCIHMYKELKRRACCELLLLEIWKPQNAGCMRSTCVCHEHIQNIFVYIFTVVPQRSKSHNRMQNGKKKRHSKTRTSSFMVFRKPKGKGQVNCFSRMMSDGSSPLFALSSSLAFAICSLPLKKILSLLSPRPSCIVTPAACGARPLSCAAAVWKQQSRNFKE